MSDLSLMAATEWARAHAPTSRAPVEFGNKVALAYLACRSTKYHAGDEKATAASLAALSVRPEVLQAASKAILKTAGYKPTPDDPLPMPVDSGSPKRPLSPTSASAQKQVEGLYAATQAAKVVTVEPAPVATQGNRFTPELEAIADRVLACAGFRSPRASTSAETSPEHALELACSPDTPAPSDSTTGASDPVPLDRGES